MEPSIVLEHRRHLIAMRSWLDGKGFYKALEALEFVRNLEKGVRKDGVTPKFDHQLSVVRLVSTLTPHLIFPEETFSAGFLHDVVEDHHEIRVADLETK